MIPLIEYLPYSVEIEGKEYGIATDFRDWIRFELLLFDESLDEESRIYLMLDFLEFNNGEYPNSESEIIAALVWFYKCAKELKETDNTSHEKVFDYAKDSGYIFAAFMQVYGLNLYETKYMHWWHFKALMDGLPDDTKLNQIIGYRSIDLNALSKNERKRYAKLKEYYSLDEKAKSNKGKTLKELEAETLAKAEKARQRANLDERR